jgi:DNA-binding beta-propeller fold protein YncE
LGRVYGLATDGEDNLITINTNVGNSKPDNPTRKGEQDVIIINIATDNITRRIELEDVIPDKSKSKCRFLHCLNGKRVYIVDLGFDCVYVLSLKETIVRSFGETGKKNGQFWDPAGLVSDQFGNTIIADSRNHRLQVFDRSRKFVGQVKFREQLKRPSGIYLDQEEAALYILNLWGNSMVKYILEKN